MNKHDKAMHDLICSTLRVKRDAKTVNEINEYNQKLGVALHNIPSSLRETNRVSIENMHLLNSIDPTGSENKWGDWCLQLAKTIDQELPNINN